MDFQLAVEDQTLQDEAREFVRQEWHPFYKTKNWDEIGLLSPFHADDEALAAQREFAKKLVARGWYTMHWPAEHGGRDASITAQLAFREGMAYEGAPVSLGGGLVAPVLMIHGTDWQKEEFLPKLANADVDFAQGFSEPNAGSDLASLQTRAVRDGDDYVINGQKIWTSGAHYGEWYHVLVRTDPEAPKHRGISYIMMQLRDEGKLTEGITLRPLIDMTRTRRWSEVFFDNVRVPARNLIGEENRGWYAAMTTLSTIRSCATSWPISDSNWKRDGCFPTGSLSCRARANFPSRKVRWERHGGTCSARRSLLSSHRSCRNTDDWASAINTRRWAGTSGTSTPRCTGPASAVAPPKSSGTSSPSADLAYLDRSPYSPTKRKRPPVWEALPISNRAWLTAIFYGGAGTP